jgi:hypothetical protein
VSPRWADSDSPAQLAAIARVEELDERERTERKQLEATRKELYAAVTEALDEHGIPLARVARVINRERDVLYRWRDQTRAGSHDDD